MDDQLNSRQKEILQRLLADPADTGSVYLSNLQDLVKSHPQSGLFRALYGRAVNESSPSIAGAYFDSRALHKLLFHADNIPAIAKERVIFQNGHKPVAERIEPIAPEASPVIEQPNINPVNTTGVPGGLPDVLNVTPPVEPAAEVKTPEFFAQPVIIPEEPVIADRETSPISDAAFILTDDSPLGRAPWELDDDYEEAAIPAPEPEPAPAEEPYHVPADEQPVIPAPRETEQASDIAPEEEHQPVNEWEYPGDQDTAPGYEKEETTSNDIGDRLAYWQSIEDEYDTPYTLQPANEVPFYNNEENQITDDVYDEITGIDDITFEPGIHSYEAAPAETEAETPADNEADRLIMGNIAATDYFTFDKAFGDRGPVAESPRMPEPATQSSAKIAPPHAPRLTLAEENTTHHDVSKYHDEKMPYSFMWWLDKTRKEHGALYQPYAQAPVGSPARQRPAGRKAAADELQQQYYENIFHFSSVEEFGVETPPTVEFDMQSKEDRIIQRFIAEDPHIHPPVGEKLDTENKAKKSSEDSDIMVTETLARIYADQMLFPKAIATYKKLMLKFPEKSRYFASRIENLEKKNN